MFRVLTNRIEPKARVHLGKDQFGFQKGVGTREARAVMRLLSEWSIDHDQDVYVCFVDYEKTFDRVEWIKLADVLNTCVDWHDRRLIVALYMGQSATVTMKGGVPESDVTGRRTRQGRSLSPLLFNTYAKVMLTEALSEVSEIICVGGWLKTVRYADDQATIASTAEGLQCMMNKMNEAAERYGIRINQKKMKVMKISKRPSEQFEILLTEF